MRKRRQCPDCNSTDILAVVYGYGDRWELTPTTHRLDTGHATVGRNKKGRMMHRGNKKWHCNKCHHEW